MDLKSKLKKNIGNAGHLKPVNNGELIIAGIVSVDDLKNTVTYLHGKALSKMNEAQKHEFDRESFITDPQNITTDLIGNFQDFITILNPSRG